MGSRASVCLLAPAVAPLAPAAWTRPGFALRSRRAGCVPAGANDTAHQPPESGAAHTEISASVGHRSQLTGVPRAHAPERARRRVLPLRGGQGDADADEEEEVPVRPCTCVRARACPAACLPACVCHARDAKHMYTQYMYVFKVYTHMRIYVHARIHICAHHPQSYPLHKHTHTCTHTHTHMFVHARWTTGRWYVSVYVRERERKREREREGEREREREREKLY